jgi:hypothetical protein
VATSADSDVSAASPSCLVKQVSIYTKGSALDQEHTISVSRRTVRLALAFAVVLAVLAPVAVVAAGGTSVDDDTSIFEEDIEWLVANAITSGCGTDTYCPEGNVTRGQMAAFMRRLAPKKVVDATTAVTADSATTADHATTADNATTADSADTAANATNASQLEGLNSTEYALGLIGFDSSNTSQTVAVGADVTMASVELDIPRRCSLLQTETVEVLGSAAAATTGRPVLVTGSHSSVSTPSSTAIPGYRSTSLTTNHGLRTRPNGSSRSAPVCTHSN